MGKPAHVWFDTLKPRTQDELINLQTCAPTPYLQNEVITAAQQAGCGLGMDQPDYPAYISYRRRNRDAHTADENAQRAWTAGTDDHAELRALADRLRTEAESYRTANHVEVSARHEQPPDE